MKSENCCVCERECDDVHQLLGTAKVCSECWWAIEIEVHEGALAAARKAAESSAYSRRYAAMSSEEQAATIVEMLDRGERR